MNKVFTGKVIKAGAYPLKEPKEFKGVTYTHRYAMECEGIGWVSFGQTTKDNFIVKDENGNWKILGAGSEVNFVYSEENGYKNAKKSALTVLKLIEGERFEQGQKDASSSSQQQNNKKDMLPIELGNALTCANNLWQTSYDNILDGVQEVYEANKKFKAELEELYPDMDKYSLGMRAGQSLVIAAQHSDTISEMTAVALEIFNRMCNIENNIRNPQLKPFPQNTIHNNFDDDDIPF